MEMATGSRLAELFNLATLSRLDSNKFSDFPDSGRLCYMHAIFPDADLALDMRKSHRVGHPWIAIKNVLSREMFALMFCSERFTFRRKH